MEISSRFFENHIMPKMLTILKILSIMKIKENLIRNEKISKYERGIIMKNIIKKSITTIVVLAMALTLVIPMIAQAKTMPKLNKTKVTISVKKSYQLKVKGTSKKVTWKSNNKKVAIVSKNGKVTGKKKGSAVITAKVNKKTYKCKVTVKAEMIPKLNKTKVTLTMTNQKGNPTIQLKVTGTGKKVKWTTSNKKVAIVSKTGKVTAKKKGNAVITAKINGRTLKCKIVVKDTHKHHWVAYDDPQPENIFGAVCRCGKVFASVEEWEQHSNEDAIEAIMSGHPETVSHYSFAGVKTVYISWIWYYYCDICGLEDYDDDYSHPVEAVVCSGCKKEFKDYEKWKKHFLENSWNGDESHRKCTVRIQQ